MVQQWLAGVYAAVPPRGLPNTYTLCCCDKRGESNTCCRHSQSDHLQWKKDVVIDLNMGKLHWIENILFVEMPMLGFELRSIFRYPIKVNCTKIVEQFCAMSLPSWLNCERECRKNKTNYIPSYLATFVSSGAGWVCCCWCHLAEQRSGQTFYCF